VAQTRRRPPAPADLCSLRPRLGERRPAPRCWLREMHRVTSHRCLRGERCKKLHDIACAADGMWRKRAAQPLRGTGRNPHRIYG